MDRAMIFLQCRCQEPPEESSHYPGFPLTGGGWDGITGNPVIQAGAILILILLLIFLGVILLRKATH